MYSKNVIATEGKLLSNLDKINQTSIEKTVPQTINEALKDVRIRTGRIVKFYPYIDKAKVKLDGNGKIVLCGILHRFGSDLIDFYTPLSYGTGYDDSLHEKYITPKFTQNVCVLNIDDNDSDEYLLLGSFLKDEIVGFNPAKPGNIKIMSVCEDGNEFWMKFGKDGFNYRLPSKPNIKVGNKYDEEGVQDFDYITGEDVYTREDIDIFLGEYEAKIKELEEKVNTLINQQNNANTNPTDNTDNNNPTDNTGSNTNEDNNPEEDDPEDAE